MIKRLAHAGRLLPIFILLACLGWPRLLLAESPEPSNIKGTIAYINPDSAIPFWDIMARGIKHQASLHGYKVRIYSANHNARKELEQLSKVIQQETDGLVISPITSSTGATLIKLASAADLPVVVSDIGADSDRYVSFIASDNFQGAHALGKVLAQALKARNWENGQVGIVAIPQSRQNGRARTAGFVQALEKAGIQAGGMRQLVDFSYTETYTFCRELFDAEPNLRALWLQTSDEYQAALDAIRDAELQDRILLVAFDAEPEFIDLIANGTLISSAMQQPFLMGEKAAQNLIQHLQGKPVPKESRLPVLVISNQNLEQSLPLIQRNVLGQEVMP